MSNKFISSRRHLDYMPNAQMAQRVLQRITSRVEPLMRRHKWKVGALEELFPDDETLQGKIEFCIL